MTRDEVFWQSVVRELVALPRETGWLELKQNKAEPQEIGEYISALANSAATENKAHGYLVWGVHDESHAILGTSFDPAACLIGAEELESWLLRLLTPKIGFQFHTVRIDEARVVVLEIDRAFRHPVQFSGVEYIRIGTYKKKLKDFQEKARELWRILDITPFEMLSAAERLSADEVVELLDYPAYFDLLARPLPSGRDGVLHEIGRAHV